MRYRNLILIAIVAALSFGGSFTCNSSSGDDDPPKPQPAK
jgi:hypothetical protein